MTINDDISWFYSGTLGTSVDSIGGAIHATEIIPSTDENLFQNITDPINAQEQYYCVYLQNDGIVSWDVNLYISTPTPSLETQIYTSLGTALVDNAEQRIVDDATEPTGVTWLQRYFDFNAMAVATLAPGSFKSIWVRLSQSANAGGKIRDYCRITLVGDETITPSGTASFDFTNADNAIIHELML